MRASTLAALLAGLPLADLTAVGVEREQKDVAHTNFVSAAAHSVEKPANPGNSLKNNVPGTPHTLPWHKGLHPADKVVINHDDYTPLITGFTPQKGKYTGGDLLTIFGTQLGGKDNEVTGVTVGGLECKDVNLTAINNATGVVTCITPNGRKEGLDHSTGYEIVLTTEKGEESRSLFNWTFNPAPVIQTIEPNNGPRTADAPITLKGLNLTMNGVEDILNITIGTVGYCDDIKVISISELTCVTKGKFKPKTKHDIIISTVLGGVGVTQEEYSINPVPTVEKIDPPDGPQEGGTRVTLTGTTLGQSKEDIINISIGRSWCMDIEWVSEQELKCTTTAHITPEEVLMQVNTTSAGWGVTKFHKNLIGVNEYSMKYKYNPPPDLSTLNPILGPKEGGTEVVIAGRYLGKSAEDVAEIYFLEALDQDPLCDAAPCDIAKKPAKIPCTLKDYTSALKVSCTMAAFPGEMLVPTFTVPYVRTVSGGTGKQFLGRVSRSLFEFVPPPEVTDLNMEKGQAGDKISLSGKNLGRSSVDILSIKIAGAACIVPTLFPEEGEKDAYVTCELGNCEPPDCIIGESGGVVMGTTTGGSATSEKPKFVNEEPKPPPPICKDSDGIVGYDFNHKGYWMGTIASQKPKAAATTPTGDNQGCADACDGLSDCVAFSRDQLNGACYTYQEVSPDTETKMQTQKAYTKCVKPTAKARHAKGKGNLRQGVVAA